MNKNCDEKAMEILAKNISSMISCDILDYESLRQKVEVEMTKREIETKYGDCIKQMSNNGRWWIRLSDGRVIKKKNRDDIIIELMKSEKERAYTLQSFWNKFFEHRKLTRSDGTNRIDKRNFENHIRPCAISKIPLARITSEDVETWATECIKKAKANNTPITEKYFLNVLGTLSQMFQYAETCGLMSGNPARIDVHANNFRPAKAHVDTDDYFSEEEKNAVIALAYADAEATKNALPLAIPLLFQTGIRDGELCGLHWRDVSNSHMHIRSEIIEQMDDDGNFNGYRWIDHCKSKAGDRIIPLNSEAKKILTEVKKLNFANGLPVGQNDFIFARKYRGKIDFCTTRCFEIRLKRYCRDAGMDVLKSQHDIRRTFATNLHYLGVPTKSISALMGHETTKQTDSYIKAHNTDDIANELEKLSMWNKNGTNGTDFQEMKKVGNA